jgi:hypothetical protein
VNISLHSLKKIVTDIKTNIYEKQLNLIRKNIYKVYIIAGVLLKIEGIIITFLDSQPPYERYKPL